MSKINEWIKDRCRAMGYWIAQKAKSTSERLEQIREYMAKNAALMKFFALLIIAFLATSDFITMYNLFKDLDFNSTEKTVMALTIAVCLEGIPSFFGLTLSKFLDKTSYKSNGKRNAAIGSGVTLVGMVLTFATVIAMRVAIYTINGDASAEDGEVGQFWAKNIYVTVAPVITSLLSFVASWVAFGSDSIERARLDREVALLKFMERESDFQDSLHRLNDARNALWSSLWVKAPMPMEFGVFRKECFIRIRTKLTANTMEEYPTLLKMYNEALESKLDEMLNHLQELSGLELGYPDLTLDHILKEYDEMAKNEIDAWCLEKAEKPLQDKLKTQIDNAVIIAQYKSAVKPIHLEKNRW